MLRTPRGREVDGHGQQTGRLDLQGVGVQPHRDGLPRARVVAVPHRVQEQLPHGRGGVPGGAVGQHPRGRLHRVGQPAHELPALVHLDGAQRAGGAVHDDPEPAVEALRLLTQDEQAGQGRAAGDHEALLGQQRPDLRRLDRTTPATAQEA